MHVRKPFDTPRSSPCDHALTFPWQWQLCHEILKALPAVLYDKADLGSGVRKTNLSPGSGYYVGVVFFLVLLITSANPVGGLVVLGQFLTISLLIVPLGKVRLFAMTELRLRNLEASTLRAAVG